MHKNEADFGIFRRKTVKHIYLLVLEKKRQGRGAL